MGHTFLVADKVLVKWDNGIQSHVVDNLDVRAILHPAPPAGIEAVQKPPVVAAIFARALELSLNEECNGKSQLQPHQVVNENRKANFATTLWTGSKIVPATVVPCVHKNGLGNGTSDTDYSEDDRVVVRVRGAEEKEAEELRWLLGDIENPTTAFAKLYGSQKYVIVWETGQHKKDTEESICTLNSPWAAAVRIATALKARQEMLMAILEASVTTWRLWLPQIISASDKNATEYEFPKLIVEESGASKQCTTLLMNTAAEEEGQAELPATSWSAFKQMALDALVSLYEGPDLGRQCREGETYQDMLVRYAIDKLGTDVWPNVPVNLVAHMANFDEIYKAIPSSALRMDITLFKQPTRQSTQVSNSLYIDPKTWKAHEGCPTRLLPPDLESRRTLLYLAALSAGHIADARAKLHFWPREVAMCEPTALVWTSPEEGRLRRWVAGCLLASIPVTVQAIRLSTLTIPNCANLCLFLDLQIPEWPKTAIPAQTINVFPTLRHTWKLPTAEPPFSTPPSEGAEASTISPPSGEAETSTITPPTTDTDTGTRPVSAAPEFPDTHPAFMS